jgi:hypothetical protein
MNIKRLKPILCYLRSSLETRDQTFWHRDYGYSHCLAGHCQLAAGKPADRRLARSDAAAYLGLTNEEAAWLFAAERTLSQLDWAAHTGQCRIYEEIYAIDGFDADGFDRLGRDRLGRDRDDHTFFPWRAQQGALD